MQLYSFIYLPLLTFTLPLIVFLFRLSHFSLMQLLSHTPTVLEFLLQQSEKRFDSGIQQHESNRKILRCLLSWVWQYLIFLMNNLVDIICMFDTVIIEQKCCFLLTKLGSCSFTLYHDIIVLQNLALSF